MDIHCGYREYTLDFILSLVKWSVYSRICNNLNFDYYITPLPTSGEALWIYMLRTHVICGGHRPCMDLHCNIYIISITICEFRGYIACIYDQRIKWSLSNDNWYSRSSIKGICISIGVEESKYVVRIGVFDTDLLIFEVLVMMKSLSW